jgi:mono/diheme cytochrome c family protein
VPENLKVITEENKLQAGELLAKMSCSNCHSLETTGKFRPMKDKLAGMGKDGIVGILYSMGEGAFPYMPKLKLPDNEYDAMAEYFISLKY